jgi:hypothetical protein
MITRHCDNSPSYNSTLWRFATMTTRHLDNSPPWQLITLTTVTMTTRHPDNSSPWQLATLTTRHLITRHHDSSTICPIRHPDNVPPYNSTQLFHNLINLFPLHHHVYLLCYVHNPLTLPNWTCFQGYNVSRYVCRLALPITLKAAGMGTTLVL